MYTFHFRPTQYNTMNIFIYKKLSQFISLMHQVILYNHQNINFYYTSLPLSYFTNSRTISYAYICMGLREYKIYRDKPAKNSINANIKQIGN